MSAPSASQPWIPASELRGRCALVTGASSGIGADFARELARRGCSLVLVARRQERLQALAQELRRDGGVRVEALPFDLSSVDAAGQLHRRVREMSIEVDILVNNAGAGLRGRFFEAPWEREAALMRLNMAALTGLSRLFGQDMMSRRRGNIVLVGSTAAWVALPGSALYAATKSFVRSLGEALDEELRGTGVRCTVVSPGLTDTGFFVAAGRSVGWLQSRLMMSSREVARLGVEAMIAGRRHVVTGRRNVLGTTLLGLLPRGLITRLVGLRRR